MKHVVYAAAGFLVLTALASPAFAQGEGTAGGFAESQITMTTPSGAVKQMKMADTAMMDMMMKEATPMTSGIVMMMHGGKMYSMSDHRMPNGKMMSDIIAGN